MITLIISGGQTGADQGGLRAAKRLGIATGGIAPHSFKTETGPNWSLRDIYCLTASRSGLYSTRTHLNVIKSDATVIFGRKSVGSNLTEVECIRNSKPYLWVSGDTPPACARFRLWLARVHPQTLNVAGNRESKAPGIGLQVEEFLVETLSSIVWGA